MTVIIRNLQRKVPLDQKKFRKKIERAVSVLGIEDAEVSFIFVNDSRSRNLNKQFRGIDKPTDVLSFPLYESLQEIKEAKKMSDVLLGDVVINLPLCKDIADREKIALDKIVLQMAIHGLLHLIGYDHERGPSEARKMRRKERQIINAIEKMD